MQITCNTSSVYHMQHAVCHLVPKDRLAINIWQSLNRIYFSFIMLAEPLTDEGGEDTGVLGGKPLGTRFRKCHIQKPEKSKP